MIRQKISSNAESMEALHLVHGWIPGSASIRPNPTTIEKKANFIANLLNRYATLQDFVLHRFFGLTTAVRGDWIHSRTYVPDTEIAAARSTASESSHRHAFRLVPNLFAYQVPAGTHHSVIWFLLNGNEPTNTDGSNHLSLADDEINASIEDALKQLQGRDENHFSFVWYPNPKPTVVSEILFHVQVFWIPGPSVTNEAL